MKMKQSRLLAGFFVGLLLLAASCKHDPQGIDQLETMYYDTDIQPILNAHCTMCHGNGRTDGDVDLTTYAGVSEVLVPGDPTKSKLYKTITAKLAVLMPPKPEEPLSQALRTKIYTWILQDAPNNQAPVPAAK
ncbi:MAG: hypothetical protein RIS47_863 [Bacteroidota bacterium]|jgi:hypothetical protein